MRRAWVLNLDVEREFEAPGSYQISRAARAAVDRAIPKIQGGLVRPGDLLLEPGMRADGLLGCAWCPSAAAMQRLRAAGAQLPATPGGDVLSRVNERAFVLEVERELGLSFGKRLIHDLEQLQQLMDRERERPFLVRRRFGAAGRGSRRFGGRGIGLQQEDPGLVWLRAGLRQGPLVVEPHMQLELECSCPGWLARGERQASIGSICVQQVDRHGAWRSSRLASEGELKAEEERSFLQAMQAAGEVLASVGYFGPFGLDGFRYRDPRGGPTRFQPLGEVNARFSMAWALGMGSAELDKQLADR